MPLKVLRFDVISPLRLYFGRSVVPYIDEYTSSLKETILMQKNVIDSLNKVVAIQQRQLEEVLFKVRRHLKVEEGGE